MTPAQVEPRQAAGLPLAIAIVIGCLLAYLWLTGALAAALFGEGWTSVGVGELVRTALRLPHHPAQPRLAWPSQERQALPGPVPLYLTAGLLLVAFSGLAAGVGRILRAVKFPGRHGGRRRPAASRWASWRDLRKLRVKGPVPGRLILGRSGRSMIAAEERQSAIVVAPPQSGKTTGLAIPALLEWAGPAVVTSVKTDLLNETLERREHLGEVMIFDPAKATGQLSTPATPLASCGGWGGALRVAHWLTSAARPAQAGIEDADFWYAAAEKLLAPMLFAAAQGGQIGDVVGWLDRGPEAREEVEEILVQTELDAAVRAWQATWNRDQRQRASIYTTAETIMAAFSDPAVQTASRRSEYTPARLLAGANTLYLCAPAHEQQRLRPLFSMMIRELVGVVYEEASIRGEPIDPPLLMVLDEAANIAPVPNLDEIASTAAGQGIQLLSVFQDLAQVRSRYGGRAQTIVNNHRAKLFGAGISDPETLTYVSRIVGAGEFRQRSQTTGKAGENSTTEATTYRELTPASVIREADPGCGLLIYGHLPPARLRLRPWYRDRMLRRLAGNRPRGQPSPAGLG